jgi:hypothetical protein
VSGLVLVWKQKICYAQRNEIDRREKKTEMLVDGQPDNAIFDNGQLKEIFE